MLTLIEKPSPRLIASIERLRRFTKNPIFDIETGRLIHDDGITVERPGLELVPAFPPAMPNSPGLGVPVNPALNVPAASGQLGPVFAQGAMGAIGLQAVDVLLTSAQILALQTTAINLVPAPLTGWHIVPLYLKLILLAGSAAYTDAGGAVSFAVGSQSVALASNGIFLVTTSPNRVIQNLLWAAAAAGTGVTGTAGNPPTEDGAALQIKKATNNFAAGNGTMKITIYYTIEPTL